MNKNIFLRSIINTCLYAAILLFAAGLVFFTKETSKSAVDAINICVNTLIPSLFPFFVISSLAVQTGFATIAGKLFARPMQFLFKLPGLCAPAFILGLVGGYPVGAKTAILLYEQKLCTREQAGRLLSFCNNSGPAFILGVVGSAMFGSAKAGLLLYGAHVLSSITVGIISSAFAKKDSFSPQYSANFKVVPLGSAFTTAITTSFTSVLNICAFVIFFAVSIKILFLLGIIPLFARALTPLFGENCAQSLIGGFFEVTTGISSLFLSAAGIKTKLTLSAFMLGWAGLSVHFQVLNFIGESGLSGLPYIVGKFSHGIFSALYVWIMLRFLPIDRSVWAPMSLSTLPRLTPSMSFLLSFALCLGLWAAVSVISLIFTQINHCKNMKNHL